MKISSAGRRSGAVFAAVLLAGSLGFGAAPANATATTSSTGDIAPAPLVPEAGTALTSSKTYLMSAKTGQIIGTIDSSGTVSPNALTPVGPGCADINMCIYGTPIYGYTGTLNVNLPNRGGFKTGNRKGALTWTYQGSTASSGTIPAYRNIAFDGFVTVTKVTRSN